MKLVYLAGPYRASTVHGITLNINRAREYAAKLWAQGYAVLCPHMNSAHFDGIAPDENFLKAGIIMLERCDAIAVMPNSEHSKGTQAEIQRAVDMGLPIIPLQD